MGVNYYNGGQNATRYNDESFTEKCLLPKSHTRDSHITGYFENRYTVTYRTLKD